MRPEEATQFFCRLGSRQVRAGMKATGSFRWFQRLLAELDQELLLGDPGAIHGGLPIFDEKHTRKNCIGPRSDQKQWSWGVQTSTYRPSGS